MTASAFLRSNSVPCATTPNLPTTASNAGSGDESGCRRSASIVENAAGSPWPLVGLLVGIAIAAALVDWESGLTLGVVGGGNARFEGTCQDRKGRRIAVRLSGTYTDTSFSFRGGAQLVRGTPYIPASITARRLSAQCPANAQYF